MTMPPSGDQPAYVDPVTGQPLFIDPSTGQLSYADPTAAQAPPVQPAGYPPLPPYQYAMPTYPGYTAPDPYASAEPPVSSDVPATGYTTPAFAPSPYGYPGYGYPMMQMQRKTNTMAITGMILSICGAAFLVCYGFGGLFGIAGAIVSHIARKKVRERNEDGAGMALAGIIIGWIVAALGVAAVIIVVVLIRAMGRADDFNTVQ